MLAQQTTSRRLVQHLYNTLVNNILHARAHLRHPCYKHVSISFTPQGKSAQSAQSAWEITLIVLLCTPIYMQITPFAHFLHADSADVCFANGFVLSSTIIWLIFCTHEIFNAPANPRHPCYRHVSISSSRTVNLHYQRNLRETPPLLYTQFLFALSSRRFRGFRRCLLRKRFCVIC